MPADFDIDFSTAPTAATPDQANDHASFQRRADVVLRYEANYKGKWLSEIFADEDDFVCNALARLGVRGPLLCS